MTKNEIDGAVKEALVGALGVGEDEVTRRPPCSGTWARNRSISWTSSSAWSGRWA